MATRAVVFGSRLMIRMRLFARVAFSVERCTMHYTGFGKFSRATPQTEPIPGSNQIKNNAGGFSWSVDDMTRLSRLLILGSASNTFYVDAKTLTKQNLDAVERLLQAGRGCEVVDKIVEISEAGRAVSNDPALFVLARCCACDVHPSEPLKDKTGKAMGEHRRILHPDDIDVRRYAYAALPKVARTGTHFLHFQAYVKQFRGRGPIHDRAIEAWYQDKYVGPLAYQVLKYQQRDGWSHRDVLRLARPKSANAKDELYHWITKGEISQEIFEDDPLAIIRAYEQAKKATDDKEIARLIKAYRLPREAVPTEHLKSVRVWEALLEDMPLEAMTRNLATMTRNGVLKPMDFFTTSVATRLRNRDLIHKARLHPIKLLAALTTYQSGKSVRGDATWTPLREITDALDEAFYLSFECVEPTKKRILLAIDTSGSMHSGRVNGIPNLSCHMAAGAMALVIAKSEPHYHIIGVDTSVQHLPISPRQRLDDAVQTLRRYGGGGTDLSLPMAYALERKLEVDAFVILSDNETWAGRNGHPAQLLSMYRQRINPNAKIVNVQMTSTHVTNNAPDDLLAMEVCGFDTSVPLAISEWLSL
ncbi:MAG TPA: TROVE domain-containing protein [Ktedonobacteraceae bacterium]